MLKRNRSVRGRNSAVSYIKGSDAYPGLSGKVLFQQMPKGVLVTAQIYGLPVDEGVCKKRFFGFHIHEGTSCSGTAEAPFADAKGHYNPDQCPHPYHRGDLPPLLGCGNEAYLSVLTNRFTIDEIIGRVVIIHERPDDFTTQPSGNAGAMIACGKIVW